MKFSQSIEHQKINIYFLKNHVENKAGRLVPVLFLFFKAALNEESASGLQVSFNIFR